MLYESHKIAGLCVGVSAAALIAQRNPTSFTLSTASILVISAMVGSALPDIDEPNSKVSKYVKPVSRVIKGIAGHRGAFHAPLILMLIMVLFREFVMVLPELKTLVTTIKIFLMGYSFVLLMNFRRGALKGMMVIIMGLLGFWLFKDPMRLSNHELFDLVWLGLVLGMASHLLMDSLTVDGIPLLYPFTKKKFSLMKLRTGEDEFIARMIFVVPVGVQLWYTYGQSLMQLTTQFASR